MFYPVKSRYDTGLSSHRTIQKKSGAAQIIESPRFSFSYISKSLFDFLKVYVGHIIRTVLSCTGICTT